MLARLSLVLSLAATLPAQCLVVGAGCGTVPRIACNTGTAPRIGSTWLIDAQNACPPSTNVMLFGMCNLNAITFTSPIACTNCLNCKLHVLPIVASINWPGIFSLGVPIPNNLSLVGAQFCIQNACVLSTCGCLSNAIQVTIQR